MSKPIKRGGIGPFVALVLWIALVPMAVWGVSTFTPNLGLEKPAKGDQNYHIPLNANFDKLDFSFTSPILKNGTAISLADSGVTPGSYTSTNLTVDAKGRITVASNGAGGSGAPTTSQYLALATDGGLTNERVFTPGTGLAAQDGGAGGSYILNHAAVATGDLHTEYLRAAGSRPLTGNWDAGNAFRIQAGEFWSRKDPYHVKAYGAVCNGSGDDTVAIQAAIDAAGAAGGGKVILPVGTCRISATLVIGNGTTTTVSYKSVHLIGQGGATGHFATQSPGPPGTKLSWVGAGGGTMLRIQGPMHDPQVLDVFFDGNNTAAVGLELMAAVRGQFTGITVHNITSLGMKLTSRAVGSGQERSTERNEFRRFTCNLTGNASATTCIKLDAEGGGGSGVFGNAFYDTLVRYTTNQQALHLRFADHNIFYSFIAAKEAGSGASVLLDNSGLGANTYPSNNLFWFPVLTGGISTTGTPPLNHFILYTSKDSQPDPGVDKGVVLTDLYTLMGAAVGLKFREIGIADASAPGADEARLFARDNGFGKTQLCAKFASGTTQCFATEPNP